MSIQVEQLGDVAVVVAAGMFTGGSETEELESTLRGLIEEQQHPQVLLNLSGTRLMLSLAIGVLASAHVGATQRGSHFYVCGIRPSLMKVMQTIKVQPNVLNHFERCDEALRALRDL
jgi:anti-anti-sigma factor